MFFVLVHLHINDPELHSLVQEGLKITHNATNLGFYNGGMAVRMDRSDPYFAAVPPQLRVTKFFFANFLASNLVIFLLRVILMWKMLWAIEDEHIPI